MSEHPRPRRFATARTTIIDEYLAEIEELQAQLAERDAECARLRADAAEHERRIAFLQSASDGSFANYDRLANVVRAVSDPAGTAPSEENANG